MKYRKKSVAIEAEQWLKVTYDREAGHGIEPEDMPLYHLGVGYYRTPELDGQAKCEHCGDIMHNHGWIDKPGALRTVCPGDWIITDDQYVGQSPNGRYYICKPTLFEQTYEVEEADGTPDN